MLIAILAAVAALAAAPKADPAPPAPVDRCAPSNFWNDTYRPTPAFPGQTRAPQPRVKTPYEVSVIAGGLVHPWSLAVLPDGSMLVSERVGRLRIILANGQVSAPIQGLPPIKLFTNEGLHDVILDRDFATNRTIYFSYSAPRADGKLKADQDDWLHWIARPAGTHEATELSKPRIARARLSADNRRLENVRVLVEGADRRIVQDAAGDLYITSATPAGGFEPVDDEPQRLGNLYGKVLKIHPDGSIPADNPYVGKKGVRPEIYALGERDQEGAALNPRTGALWTVEHGPRGGDELNIVKKGANYGFPIVSYGRNYNTTLIDAGRTAGPEFEQPAYFWTPSIAPSGLLFYTGAAFPQWQGSLFVGGLSSKRLVRLELDGDRVVAEEPMLIDRCRRIRDVRQAPDGSLLVLTDENDGELLRISPSGQPN